MDDPVNGFFTCARTGQLPNVSFIDPHFVDFPPGSNCDEPPSDIVNGQELVQADRRGSHRGSRLEQDSVAHRV